jgi:hypothetical protein
MTRQSPGVVLNIALLWTAVAKCTAGVIVEPTGYTLQLSISLFLFPNIELCYMYSAVFGMNLVFW